MPRHSCSLASPSPRYEELVASRPARGAYLLMRSMRQVKDDPFFFLNLPVCHGNLRLCEAGRAEPNECRGTPAPLASPSPRYEELVASRSARGAYLRMRSMRQVKDEPFFFLNLPVCHGNGGCKAGRADSTSGDSRRSQRERERERERVVYTSIPVVLLGCSMRSAERQRTAHRTRGREGRGGEEERE
jgi:hypothetical protein